MEFWLGVHRPNWLSQTDVPLMVSHGTLRTRKSLPRALGRWVLDSQGFTQLRDNGRWLIAARDYASATRRYIQEIGGLEWAAIQDWMCEPFILRKTGLSIEDHQRRTIDSWFELNDLAPDVPWIPVVQGWNPSDYLRHVDQWLSRGVDLLKQRIVGIGSVCRRQGVRGAIDLLVRLHREGLRLHGFGLKITAVRLLASFLASSDSMAWSFEARKRKMRCGNPSSTCSNHLHRALEWREMVLASFNTRPLQLGLTWDAA